MTNHGEREKIILFSRFDSSEIGPNKFVHHSYMQPAPKGDAPNLWANPEYEDS